MTVYSPTKFRLTQSQIHQKIKISQLQPCSAFIKTWENYINVNPSTISTELTIDYQNYPGFDFRSSCSMDQLFSSVNAALVCGHSSLLCVSAYNATSELNLFKRCGLISIDRCFASDRDHFFVFYSSTLRKAGEKNPVSDL